MVLWHELAHVRRGDAGSHLLARAALSLYWWNPLLWLAWRQFLRERERAADDIVLNGGARLLPGWQPWLWLITPHSKHAFGPSSTLKSTAALHAALPAGSQYWPPSS